MPERFAIHKLIVSELRGREAKARKDRVQAVVLCAALGDLQPGALESAVNAVPPKALRLVRNALGRIRDPLESDSPRAWEELTSVKGWR